MSFIPYRKKKKKKKEEEETKDIRQKKNLPPPPRKTILLGKGRKLEFPVEHGDIYTNTTLGDV